MSTPISRRAMLASGLAAGVSLFARPHGADAAAPQPRTAVSFDVPAGSCDCAVHVFGDRQQFPYSPARSYTPEPATVDELRQMLQALRLDRVVVVQATPYGTDNSCVIDSLGQLGERARGVAVIDEAIPDVALDDMHRAGIRGIRLPLGNLGITDLEGARRRLRAAVARIERLEGWSVQITALPPTFEALHAELMALPVPLVIDHFGEVAAEQGLQQPGFGTIIELVRTGRAYVKISHADNLSRRPDLSDITPFATALIAANPQRVVWGTAWPHPTAGAVTGRKSTDIALHRQADDGRVMNMLPVWAPDAAVRRLILVENPARLYDF